MLLASIRVTAFAHDLQGEKNGGTRNLDGGKNGTIALMMTLTLLESSSMSIPKAGPGIGT
ncbi:MAG TPA: hypothetical protein ENI00_05300 [Marinobacter antarcticus]|uniref:Uncharacterized protein n=1 Tax=Marinobacter antarcticus TaxID=564117 RepID=A0A831VUI8_9GAMM|nr:hypothetical protein [Marinobacter antarcticus]